jgi:hypothetical protein
VSVTTPLAVRTWVFAALTLLWNASDALTLTLK